MLSSCVRPSVCLSLSLSHAGIIPKGLNIESRKQRHRQQMDSSLQMLKISAKHQPCHPKGGAKLKWGRFKSATFNQYLAISQQVSAASDRPTRRNASGPPCCTQMSTVSVINWWPRPSAVYHTDRPPKLTAPETISRSRDMVGANQNLNGSRDLTTSLSGMVCHP